MSAGRLSRLARVLPRIEPAHLHELSLPLLRG